MFMGLLNIVAQATLSIAAAAAGLTSFVGWHQPKVPDRLCK